MSRINVFGHKYGHDDSSASTRVRFSRVLAAMQDISIVKQQEEADVVYIQKRANEETLAIVAKANANKQPCVYDLDDAPGQCASIALERELMSRATLITTDTVTKADRFSSMGHVGKVRFVPDCLDYFDEPPAFEVRPEIKTVVTFGNVHSVRAVIPFLLSLRNTFFELSFVYVMSEQLIEADRIRFVRWTPEVTMSEMLRADVGIFCHPSDMSGTLRPATRYITAMAAGLPSIALCSGGHPSLLEDADLRQYMFSGEDVKDKLRILGSYNVRKELSPRIQRYAWDNYSPTTTAKKLRCVFMEAMDAA